jgi:hypothetical protein
MPEQDDKPHRDLVLHELIIETRENSRLLRETMRRLRKNDATKYLVGHAHLKACAGITTPQSSLSHYMDDDKRSLNGGDHEKLTRYYWDQGYWTNHATIREALDGINDNLFHSLTQFLGVHIGTQFNSARRCEGTFRLWRPSTHVPGCFVLGMIEISYDHASLALKTCEKQRYQSSDGTRSREEIFSGYLIRKSKKYCIVAKDRSVDSLRVTYLHYWHREQNQVVGLGGVTVGLYDNFAYAAPIYIERYEGSTEDLEQSLDIVPESAVPPSVLARLRRCQKGDFVAF